ncbi:histidine kinase dimerization/phosphoacceptor domain -containing protein [Fibrella sp. WM1]|uniref:tetratricopeptide repeat-containing sensor histidine kinase n=1 Tax=Fibrella musci TaxID=3242485 RepID=UPI0035221690
MSQLYVSLLIGLGTLANPTIPPPDSAQVAVIHARWQAHRFVRPDSSYWYARHLFALTQQSRKPADLAQGYLTLGLEERDRGNYAEALNHLQRALSYREQLGDQVGVATVYQTLALTYKRMGDSQHVAELTRRALDYANQAHATFVATNARPAQIANALNTIAIIERDLKNLPAAYKAYQRAIALLEPLQTTIPPRDLSTLALLYGNLGQYFCDIGQPGSALEHLNKALVLNTKLGEKTALEHNNRNLSNAYQRLHDYGKAVDYADRAIVLSRAIKDPHRLFNTLMVSYKAYRGAGNYQQALAMLEEQKLIEDSLLRADKSRQITIMQARFDTDRARQLAEITAQKDRLLAETRTRLQLEHEGELARIEADKARDLSRLRAKADFARAELQTRYDTETNRHLIETLNDENERRTQQVVWLSMGAGLFLLLSGLLLLLYQRVRNSRAEVQRQSEQLKLLMRELHHRVKNNLAVVSGLLELQANRISDMPVRQAFVESQQRVQAMSLIHQRLYQSDATTRINLREFSLDLIGFLSDAYGYADDELTRSLQLDIDEIDVDVAIPLGLIMNELLTNAFKYGFPQASQPNLTLQLWRDDVHLCLLLADNGPGFNTATWNNAGKTSFGRRLIYSLSDQLGARLSIDTSAGTQVRLTIPAHTLQVA